LQSSPEFMQYFLTFLPFLVNCSHPSNSRYMLQLVLPYVVLPWSCRLATLVPLGTSIASAASILPFTSGFGLHRSYMTFTTLVHIQHHGLLHDLHNHRICPIWTLN
jgi:uncharacterized ion transporter superfamily protein YfcC